MIAVLLVVEFFKKMQQYCQEYNDHPVIKLMLGRKRNALVLKAEAAEVGPLFSVLVYVLLDYSLGP